MAISFYPLTHLCIETVSRVAPKDAPHRRAPVHRPVHGRPRRHDRRRRAAVDPHGAGARPGVARVGRLGVHADLRRPARAGGPDRRRARPPAGCCGPGSRSSRSRRWPAGSRRAPASCSAPGRCRAPGRRWSRPRRWRCSTTSSATAPRAGARSPHGPPRRPAAAASGWVLGGLLAGGPGWRWRVPRQPPDRHRGDRAGEPPAARAPRALRRRPRIANGAALTVALALLGLGLTRAQQAGPAAARPPLLAALVAGVAFARLERRAARPLLPARLLRSARFARAGGAALVLTATHDARDVPRDPLPARGARPRPARDRASAACPSTSR